MFMFRLDTGKREKKLKNIEMILKLSVIPCGIQNLMLNNIGIHLVLGPRPSDSRHSAAAAFPLAVYCVPGTGQTFSNVIVCLFEEFELTQSWYFSNESQWREINCGLTVLTLE